jgi:hypothetical protein
MQPSQDVFNSIVVEYLRSSRTGVRVDGPNRL